MYRWGHHGSGGIINIDIEVGAVKDDLTAIVCNTSPGLQVSNP